MREIFDAYMHSVTWRGVRAIVIKRYAGRCRNCGCKPWRKVVHHKSYLNWGKGNEDEVKDCELLCNECHNAEHEHGNIVVPFFAMKCFREGFNAGKDSQAVRRG